MHVSMYICTILLIQRLDLNNTYIALFALELWEYELWLEPGRWCCLCSYALRTPY